MQAVQLSAPLGAVVSGVRLDALRQDEVDEVHTLLDKHHVLFFREQPVSMSLLHDFALAMGTIRTFTPDDLAKGRRRFVDRDYPEITAVTTHLRAETWHTDVTFRASPNVATVVQYVEGPTTGGDTSWSNLQRAYDALSPPLRAMISDLTAVHTASSMLHPEQCATHPVVRVHPSTGRPSLYVNRTFTSHIVELSWEESASILAYLYYHSERPHFNCRWSWSVGDVCIWDNRCTSHIAHNDFPVDAPRRLHRISILGDNPQPLERYKPEAQQ